MYEGFINAAREELGSKVNVVVDRFHVAKNYRKSVDTLRKKELKKLKKELSTKDYKKLKGAMWSLRKKPCHLKEEEKEVLLQLFQYSPDLEKAYNLQNKLTTIFNRSISKRKAATAIKKWKKDVLKSDLSCFDTFISTLELHWDAILNYFDHRSNSGFVEGFNNKIKVIKRRCYGIYNIENLFKRIQIDCAGYDVFS